MNKEEIPDHDTTSTSNETRYNLESLIYKMIRINPGSGPQSIFYTEAL